ncbi:3'-5' exonuclease [Alkalimonas amylolytica]|uniref:Inhibitor of the KinA pathway to sporulation, predicted exonuclease n=1 Tax=Alkalimonas amylolytica TaxID=152573 RepID=A0A1H4BBG7_ALKAM|nr:3'-5' exonuclease [Alkalimonas amylolytica]SEA45328.1 Inhibitor of the KinA pathway to sporulation, predicted exonuclease [Alkalimonas amylolytica]
MPNQLFIVDLEATCWDGDVPGLSRRQTVDDMEVIEFGCVVATTDGSVLDARSFMVCPLMRPVLSAFCTELTSIRQQDVDGAPIFSEVIVAIDAWLQPYSLNAWGSWGDYDRHQLLAEQQRYGQAPSFMALEHINLKKRWREGRASNRRSALPTALAHHGLQFDGSYHRGIDDARNIARLLPFMTC